MPANPTARDALRGIGRKAGLRGITASETLRRALARLMYTGGRLGTERRTR